MDSGAGATTGGTADPEPGVEALLDAALSGDRLRAIEHHGALPPPAVERAAVLAFGSPPAAAWRPFLLRGLLIVGAAHVVSGALFLLAESWEDIGRVGSLGVAALVAALPALLALRLGAATTAGRVCLGASTLLAGGVPGAAAAAYSSGGEPWVALAIWAALAVPFAFAARSGVVWVVPLLVIHATAIAGMDAAGFDETDASPWLLHAGIGTALWFTWTSLGRSAAWMRSRVVPRVEGGLALASAACAVLLWVFDAGHDDASGAMAAVLLTAGTAWLAGSLRARSGDAVLAVLALLAWIVAGSAALVRGLVDVMDTEFAFSLTGLVLLAATAGAVVWLRHAAKRLEPEDAR